MHTFYIQIVSELFLIFCNQKLLCLSIYLFIYLSFSVSVSLSFLWRVVLYARDCSYIYCSKSLRLLANLT